MQANVVVLEGVVVSREVMRFTPGGVETLNLVLQHKSRQIQTDGKQAISVELEISAIAFGEVALAMNLFKPRDTISVKGFLSQKNQYNPQPILHISQFKMLSES